MTWPPVKAWTSIIKRKGYNHFVAVNYGGILGRRWVCLVSVLDGGITLKVSWSDLQDISQWRSGWDELIDADESFEEDTLGCKHPSFDSGLSIPLDSENIRPWF